MVQLKNSAKTTQQDASVVRGLYTNTIRYDSVWQAVVDVPPSLQRVVELLHHVVDIVQ